MNNQLPNEILAYILEYADPKTLGRVSCTCRHLHRIAWSPSMWHVFYQKQVANVDSLWDCYLYPQPSYMRRFDLGVSSRDISNEIKAAITRIELSMMGCVICRQNITSPCIRCHCRTGKPCEVAEGVCGHRFHAHCIYHWLEIGRAGCPIDNYDWLTTNQCAISELRTVPVRDRNSTDWRALYYGEMQAFRLLQKAISQPTTCTPNLP